jgi:hypothetical protein
MTPDRLRHLAAFIECGATLHDSDRKGYASKLRAFANDLEKSVIVRDLSKAKPLGRELHLDDFLKRSTLNTEKS